MEKEQILIKDLAILWKKDKRQYVKQSTYSAYALIVENQIIPTFGNLEHCEWDIKYPTAPEKQGIEVLTASNHRKILDYISQNFTFRNLGIYVCLTTGLRIGEVCGMKWSDLDIERSMLTVLFGLSKLCA